jgi:hypothetical protein
MRNDVGSDTTPSKVGVLIQGGIFVESDFADRFFWARTHANGGRGIGAPTVAAKIGCSPGLISNLENHGAKGSKFNDKFAKLFGVDPQWLRDGTGNIPKGFDADDARETRRRGGGTVRAAGAEVVHIGDFKGPRWANDGESIPSEAANEEERADALQKRIFSDFQDYAKIIGRERALALVEVLTRLTALVQTAAEKAKRDGD